MLRPGICRPDTSIPGEVKKVLDSRWSVVISLISVVTLMSRPTTGGILLKPSNLKHRTRQRDENRANINKNSVYNSSAN